jgi:hypothetical protein
VIYEQSRNIFGITGRSCPYFIVLKKQRLHSPPLFSSFCFGMSKYWSALRVYAPILADSCDFVASLLVISAVVQFSNKSWQNHKENAAKEEEHEIAYMDNEFLVAKRRSMAAIVFVLVGYMLKVAKFVGDRNQ